MSWEIYDRLLSQIPDDILIEDVLQHHWWLVKTKDNVGISMHFDQPHNAHTLVDHIKGMKLKILAQYIKSWNFFEATAAIAAINAFYNTAEKIAPLKPRYTQDVFKELRSDIQGKNVAVIGHFPLIEELSNICTLSILERNPSPSDYPDSACEYILPQQDYIFITGTTFANKTLPRLLELGKNAKIVMTGPSVPLTPILFEYGVNILAGAIAAQPPQLWSAVEQKAGQSIFEHGAQMVQIEG